MKRDDGLEVWRSGGSGCWKLVDGGWLEGGWRVAETFWDRGRGNKHVKGEGFRLLAGLLSGEVRHSHIGNPLYRLRKDPRRSR